MTALDKVRERVSARSDRDRRAAERVALVAIVVVATLPLLRVAALSYHQVVIPFADYALIERGARLTSTGHSPLLGVYSRYGWYHPGPALYWSLAPFVRVAGGASWGVGVGAPLVEALAIALAVWWADRVAGLLCALATALVAVLTFVALGETYRAFALPWNPFVALPWLTLLVLLAWSMGLGRVSALPGAVAVGTFLVQAHVTYALIVAVALAWGLVAGIVGRHRRSERLPRWPFVLAVVVAGTMWALPVVDLVTHGRSSNVAELTRYAATREARAVRASPYELDAPAIGWHDALGLMAAESRVPPPWVGGPTAHLAIGGGIVAPARVEWLALPAALVAAAGVVAWRRRNRPALHALGLTTLLWITGTVTLARMARPPTDFAFFWRGSLTLFVVVAALGAILTSLPQPARRFGERVAAAVLALALLVASANLTADAVSYQGGTGFAIGAALPTLVEQLDQGRSWPTHPVQVVTDDQGGWTFGAALINELERRDRDVFATPRFSRAFLLDERARGRRARLTRWYAATGWQIGYLRNQPGAQVLAASTILDPATEQELERLQATLAGDLATVGHPEIAWMLDDPTQIAKLQRRLPTRSTELARLAAIMASHPWPAGRYAIVALPPGSPEPPAYPRL